jgi:hypothetical protein
MRWNTNKRGWKQGDIRYVRRFLLFPKCLDGEWRWLEMAVIRQVVVSVTPSAGPAWRSVGWGLGGAVVLKVGDEVTRFEQVEEAARIGAELKCDRYGSGSFRIGVPQKACYGYDIIYEIEGELDYVTIAERGVFKCRGRTTVHSVPEKEVRQ